MEPIDTVCVFGAGFMGWQIGLTCANRGYPVRLYDISEKALKRALSTIKQELDTRVEAGEVSAEELEDILKRIVTTEDVEEAVEGADLVIEAVPERLELKREVFTLLDRVCDEKTILATNSSSIRISKIEDASGRLDRVLNTHFYGVPWRRPVVELMRGTGTSDETMERVHGFMESVGLIPLRVLKDSTGVDDGVATFEDVDRAWMGIYRASMGPFGLMDRVGLDVVRDIEMVYYEESGDERDAPPRLLLDKIERGELGLKTGKGFYSYPDPEFQDPDWLRGKTLSIEKPPS
jgi:3-hydroxybutyryl-CoA dehydrogenase